METNNGSALVKESPSRAESKPLSNKVRSPIDNQSVQRTSDKQDVPKTVEQPPSRESIENPKTANLTPQQTEQPILSRPTSQVPNTAQRSPQKALSNVGSRPASQAPKLTPQLGIPVPQTASNAPKTAASQVPRTAKANIPQSHSGSQIPRTAQQVPETAPLEPQTAGNGPQPSYHPSRVETGYKPPPSGRQASRQVGSHVPGASQIPPGTRLGTIRTQLQVPISGSNLPRTTSQVPQTGSKRTADAHVPKTARTHVATNVNNQGNIKTSGASHHSQRQSNHTGTNRTKTHGQASQRTGYNIIDDEEGEEYEGEYYNEVEDFSEYGYEGDYEEDAERAAIVEPLDYNGCDCFPKLSRPGGHSMVYDQLRCEHNDLTGYQHKSTIRFQDNWDDNVAQSVRKKKIPDRPPRKRTILGYPPTELSFPRKGERRMNYIEDPDYEQYEEEGEEYEGEHEGLEEVHGSNPNILQTGTRTQGNSRGQTRPIRTSNTNRSGTGQQNDVMDNPSTGAGKTPAKTGQSLKQQQIEEDIDIILPPIGVQKSQSQAMSRSFHGQHSLPVISPHEFGRMTAIEEQSETGLRATQESRATLGYNMASEAGSYEMQGTDYERGSRASVAPSIVIPERQPFRGKAYDPVSKQVYNYYVNPTGRNWQYNRTLDS